MAEHLDIAVNPQTTIHLEPREAVELAIRLLLESGTDYARAAVIDTPRGRRLDIKWRPNSHELRSLAEKLDQEASR